MADLLGKHDDAAMFYQLGQNYKNLFDPTTGFMRGKSEDGKWREPFRPDQEYWEDYTESDAWQATFNVMQDVQGLIDLYGGDNPFIAKLDALFAAPSDVLESPPDITGMVGQVAQGNEPSNHIPYLYNFAGAAWKTQERVRQIARLYNNTPQGIPGNDDCGQISTWFVFAALGFYPVNAVTGVYVLGSPLVNRATLRNPAQGTTFTVVAQNNSDENLYVQSVELNRKPLTHSWFTHADILDGGELRFHMGREPNKTRFRARKTVLRGGWGLMYSYGLEGGNASGARVNTPYISSLDSVSPTNYSQGGSPFSNVSMGLLWQATKLAFLGRAGQSHILCGLPSVGQPVRQVAYPQRRQVDQQLGKIELRVYIVAAAA
jgi:putative alpha-1,2-mannosidase